MFFVLSSFSYAQSENLTCLDFSKGEFRNVDENSNLSSIIVRSGIRQLEVIDGVESYKKIQWLNDCNYVLFFTDKDAFKDPFKKLVNKNGGISVVMKKIEGSIFYYETYYFDGKREVKGQGRIIKISKKASF
jgi:hypothetical protein